MGTSWEYYWNAVGIPWECSGITWNVDENVVVIFFGLGAWEHYGNTLGILWKHSGNALGMLWEYFGNTILENELSEHNAEVSDLLE